MAAFGYERLSPRPIPSEIRSQMTKMKDVLHASSYVAWIKVTSGAGLTLSSNPDIPLFRDPDNSNVTSIHGRFSNPATIGTSETGKWNSGVREVSGPGYRPRPIVESIEVKNGKHGLSKKATVNIKCFSIEQLTELAKHFLEPGFSIVIQWGWNNGGTNAVISGDPIGFTTVNNFTKNQSRKISTGGCKYENFIGTVTGGNMSVNDASFDLTMEATGVGELALNLQVLNEVSCEDATTSNTQVDDSSWTNTVTNAWKNSQKWVLNKITAFNNYWDKSQITDYDDEPFLAMYGSLPPELQTDEIKKMKMNWRNFVGFNESALEKAGQLGFWGDVKAFLGFGPQGATIANVDLGDEPLIDGDRFIRFGALMGMLEKVPYDLKKGINLAGGSSNVSLIINTEKVPISAHKRIFSTDKSKLLILNGNTPDFGLLENFENAQRNPASLYVFWGKSTSTAGTPTNPIINTTYPRNNGQPEGTFPYPGDLKDGNIDAPWHSWGYLEDLYINFDFAMSVLKQPGIMAKDALLQMLNGMSSAVNNLWDFQVVEDVDQNGNLRLSVADLNFNRFANHVYPTFYHTGVESVFKSISYSIDIPAAMKNQILAKRTSDGSVKPKFNPHLPDPHPTLWGSSLKDNIMTELNKTNSAVDPCAKNVTSPIITTPDDAKQKNALEFVKKAGIFLKHRNPELIKGSDDASMKTLAQQNHIFVGTFSDTAILDNIRAADKGTNKRDKGILLPITVEFTVPGVGGLEFGQSFKLGDTINKFRDTGIFQITEISHNVSNNFWETKVESKFRPL
jgi:hypothetical protein